MSSHGFNRARRMADVVLHDALVSFAALVAVQKHERDECEAAWRQSLGDQLFAPHDDDAALLRSLGGASLSEPLALDVSMRREELARAFLDLET